MTEKPLHRRMHELTKQDIEDTYLTKFRDLPGGGKDLIYSSCLPWFFGLIIVGGLAIIGN